MKLDFPQTYGHVAPDCCCPIATFVETKNVSTLKLTKNQLTTSQRAKANVANLWTPPEPDVADYYVVRAAVTDLY